MIELTVLSGRFSCKTKEQLWHQELKQTIQLVQNDHLSFVDIKSLNKEQNIYNASSESFSNEIDEFHLWKLEKNTITKT